MQGGFLSLPIWFPTGSAEQSDIIFLAIHRSLRMSWTSQCCNGTIALQVAQRWVHRGSKKWVVCENIVRVLTHRNSAFAASPFYFQEEVHLSTCASGWGCFALNSLNTWLADINLDQREWEMHREESHGFSQGRICFHAKSKYRNDGARFYVDMCVYLMKLIKREVLPLEFFMSTSRVKFLLRSFPWWRTK
jgi:hypothetical protein